MGLKVGRLDFKAHGLLGTAGLVLLGASLCCSTDTASYLVLASIPITTGLAYGSYALLGHAPERTVIARGIVAPHREAYRRAIGVVLYVNVRLAWAAQGWPLGARPYGVACALLAAKLAPTKAFDNGNTFVFVVPIFCGVGLDAARQVRCVASDECAWNAEVATLRTVAAVQFVALLVSFAFTLGFRGYIRLARLYALSAGAVAGILGALAGGGIVGALAVGSTSAFVLDRWIAARQPPPASPKTLETLTAVARALGEDTAVVPTKRRCASLAKVAPVAAEPVAPAKGEPAKKSGSLLARARSWLATGEEEHWDGGEARLDADPTDDDVRKCLARVPEAFAAHPSAKAWARQALIVQRGSVDYAAKKLTTLAAFRDRYGWAGLPARGGQPRGRRATLGHALGAAGRGQTGPARRGVQRARAARVQGPRGAPEVAVPALGAPHAGRGDGAPRRRRRRGLVGVQSDDAPEAVGHGRAAGVGHARGLSLPPAHDLRREPAAAPVAGRVLHPRLSVEAPEGPPQGERVALEARGLRRGVPATDPGRDAGIRLAGPGGGCCGGRRARVV